MEEMFNPLDAVKVDLDPALAAAEYLVVNRYKVRVEIDRVIGLFFDVTTAQSTDLETLERFIGLRTVLTDAADSIIAEMTEADNGLSDEDILRFLNLHEPYTKAILALSVREDPEAGAGAAPGAGQSLRPGHREWSFTGTYLIP